MKLLRNVTANWKIVVASFALGALTTATALKIASVLPGAHDVVLRNPWDESLEKKIAGKWLFDDLRTPQIEQEEVFFTAEGKYRDKANASIYSIRWFTNAGELYFASDRIDGVQKDGKDYVFSVVPEFDATEGGFTIAFDGKAPHGKYTRAPNT